jgi:hypothetical protein
LAYPNLGWAGESQKTALFADDKVALQQVLAPTRSIPKTNDVCRGARGCCSLGSVDAKLLTNTRSHLACTKPEIDGKPFEKPILQPWVQDVLKEASTTWYKQAVANNTQMVIVLCVLGTSLSSWYFTRNR